MRVLIVEDEAIAALDLEVLMEDLGHEVVGTVASRADLLALPDGVAPDLALVDVNLMDGATGPEIAQELAHRFGTVIVFVTANRDQAAPYGHLAAEILAKPVLDGQIAALLAKLDGGRSPVSRPR